MLRRFSPLFLVLQYLGDLALTVLAMRLAEQIRLRVVIGIEQRDQFVAVQPYVYLLVIIIWSLFYLLLGVYDSRRRLSLAGDLGNLWLATSVSILILSSFFYLLAEQPPQAPSRLFIAYFFALDLGLLSLAHAALFRLFAALRKRGKQIRHVLLVGAGIQGRHVAVRLRGAESGGLRVVGYLSSADESMIPGLERLGKPTEVLDLVQKYRVDEIVVALPAEQHADVLRMVSDLSRTDVNVRIMPDVFEMVAMRARVEDLYGLPLISIREPSITPVQVRIKRAFDLVISCVLLVLVSPLMLGIAIWIRLDSPGPIVIHQRRIGAGGMPFLMHKFRTMAWDPGQLEVGAVKRPHDPRVTRAGRFLRRTSLDELAQLWNVVKGEMSLVGPRPELPAIVERYEPWQRKRFLVPPGMTGWWQVNGRADLSMHMNTEIDLFYVQNYSILLDLQILLRTIGAVIRGKGAY